MLLNEIIIIRVEASNKIGFGHLSRCIALCASISQEANVIFFTNSEEVVKKCKNLNIDYLKCSNDIEGIELLKAKKIDLQINSFIVDCKESYSAELVLELKQSCKKIFFIENISNGTPYADGIIYPAAHFNYERVYASSNFKIPKNKIFHGAEYVLIRDALKKYEVKNGGGIVVTTGASDPNRVMLRIDELLATLRIKAHFLIGENFKFKLNNLGEKYGSTYSKYSPKYIAGSDLVISTFGVSVYEALFFSKTIISIGHNKENSLGSSILSERSSQVIDLGFYKSIKPIDLKEGLEYCSKLKKTKSSKIVDGKGASRIANLVSQYD